MKQLCADGGARLQFAIGAKDDLATLIQINRDCNVSKIGVFHSPACEWSYDEALDGALKRAGAEGVVVAIADHGGNEAVTPKHTDSRSRQAFPGGQFGQFLLRDGFDFRDIQPGCAGGATKSPGRATRPPEEL